MKQGKRFQKNGKVIKKSSIKNYLQLQQLLVDFSAYKGKVLRMKDFDNITNIRERKSENNYWKNFYFDFTQYLYFIRKGHDNYVGAQMKLLRAFFNYQKEREEPTPGNYFHKFYVVHEDIPVIVLTPERFNFLIYNKKFENSLPVRLQILKDMFVFGCTTGVRYSDLMRINHTNLERINDNIYLCLSSQKTGTFTRMYLPDYAKIILTKFKSRRKKIFPARSISNFNLAIKKIALLAGWTEEITKTRNKRGETFLHSNEKNKNFRFCDIVSSHTMRRTAITTFLRMGMNETNARLISGHKANSTSFYRYVSYADGFMDEEMIKYFEKLKNIKMEE